MKILFVSTLCLITGIAFASDEYNWPSYSKTTLPDSLKSEDALYLDNRRTIDFMQHDEMNIVTFKRILINSAKGVEDFAEREIYVFNEGRVALKKARIIKTDGSIIELDDKNIIETFMEEKRKYSVRNHKRIQFVFPGLGVGDVIDLVYQIDFDEYRYSNTLYLEDDLISLNSRITLRNTSEMELSLFPSKSMGGYSSSEKSDTPNFTWNKTGVGKRTDGTFASPGPDPARVVYSLWYPNRTLDYGELYKYELMTFTPLSGAGSIDKTLFAEGVLTSVESSAERLIKLLDHLTSDTWMWIPEDEVSSSVKTMDYFRRHQINETLFFRYVQLYCSELHYKYDIGYTRSLLDGEFEHSYIAFDQLDLRYLLIRDEHDGSHYLFGPDKNHFYKLDEIPYYAEGNQSVLMHGDKINMETVSKLPLPVSATKDNRHTGNILVRVENNRADSVFIKRNDTFTGHYAYLLRGGDHEDWLSDFGVTDTLLLPTSVNPVYPFETIFKKEEKAVYDDYITSLDDTLFVFQPAALLPAGIYFGDESVADFGENIILPFLKYDKLAVYLEYPQPIALAEQTGSYKTENAIGSLVVTATQPMENQLKFTFELQLKQRVIRTEEEQAALEDLLNNWKVGQSRKWAIRKK